MFNALHIIVKNIFGQLKEKTQMQLRQKWKNMYRSGKIQRHLEGQELTEFLDEWKKWRKGVDGLVLENNVEVLLYWGRILFYL